MSQYTRFFRYPLAFPHWGHQHLLIVFLIAHHHQNPWVALCSISVTSNPQTPKSPHNDVSWCSPNWILLAINHHFRDEHGKAFWLSPPPHSSSPLDVHFITCSNPTVQWSTLDWGIILYISIQQIFLMYYLISWFTKLCWVFLEKNNTKPLYLPLWRPYGLNIQRKSAENSLIFWIKTRLRRQTVKFCDNVQEYQRGAANSCKNEMEI